MFRRPRNSVALRTIPNIPTRPNIRLLEALMASAHGPEIVHLPADLSVRGARDEVIGRLMDEDDGRRRSASFAVEASTHGREDGAEILLGGSDGIEGGKGRFEVGEKREGFRGRGGGGDGDGGNTEGKEDGVEDVGEAHFDGV